MKSFRAVGLARDVFKELRVGSNFVSVPTIHVVVSSRRLSFSSF